MRMGRGSSPAFQRRSREPEFGISSVRSAENVSVSIVPSPTQRQTQRVVPPSSPALRRGRAAARRPPPPPPPGADNVRSTP
eukprot:gene12104-biopygen1881